MIPAPTGDLMVGIISGQYHPIISFEIEKEVDYSSVASTSTIQAKQSVNSISYTIRLRSFRQPDTWADGGIRLYSEGMEYKFGGVVITNGVNVVDEIGVIDDQRIYEIEAMATEMEKQKRKT